MNLRKLLIANRGEIAVRIARTAADLGTRTVGIHAADDADCPHVDRVDEVWGLAKSGPAAYLDMAAIVDAALASGCNGVHPGYGFLSENAAFARACRAAGLMFIGPDPETLETFGDKTRARRLAQSLGIPVAVGSDGPVTAGQARRFFQEQATGGVMVKAIAGGGGRGMRPVRSVEDIESAVEQCAAEALAAFGNAGLYVEELLPDCRHVEIQVAGDGERAVALGSRDCTLQRARQKLIEIAPAPHMPQRLLDRMSDAALSMATQARLTGLGTFEFLVDASGGERFVFVEANPRIQVEHTVTEEVLGLDLVRLQIQLANGARIEDTELEAEGRLESSGFAIQLRINAERMLTGGAVAPSVGTIETFDVPGGPGVRCDTHGRVGLALRGRYDSLLVKVIVHSRTNDFSAVVAKAGRALRELRIAGVDTNADVLAAVLECPEVASARFHTTMFEDRFADFVSRAREIASQTAKARALPPAGSRPDAGPEETRPLPDADAAVPEGVSLLRAVLHGTIVSWLVRPGEKVKAGQTLGFIEAMKMQHAVEAPGTGVVQSVSASVDRLVSEGDVLCGIRLDAEAEVGTGPSVDEDPDRIRADLAEVHARTCKLLDESRPEAVAKRHAAGGRTARENIEDLCDPGSFQEYGGLAIAAQRHRRSLQDLIDRTPADGMIAGTGRVNGERFADEAARCMVMAYDYTVLAGTQGTKNHEKKDRMFELAAEHRWPVVAFAEGGGGRPGDVDIHYAASLHIKAFTSFARLSGKVPLVGVVSGRCFAGNAVIAGCCDVIIATENTSLGMGGPAMIEGGGLGVFRPDDVGPVEVQSPNGVIDVVVRDEREAVRIARQYLSYVQGSASDWTAHDQRRLRNVVPENRLRAYDVRTAVDILADTDTVLELRPRFAPNMVTAFVRVEGRPMGVIANNPRVLGGAIDADAADKAARFLQLCDAYGLPVLSLCDTPGNMVGPEAEKTALVRHCCRLYVVGANLRVPIFSVVLRKAYGLGAQGMVGGSFHRPVFAVSWPTGEFGPMNLEGAVRLGYRKELEAIADPVARTAEYERLVAEAYERGKALNAATQFEIDNVIDPADTREWIVRGLRAMPPSDRSPAMRARAWVDTW